MFYNNDTTSARLDFVDNVPETNSVPTWSGSKWIATLPVKGMISGKSTDTGTTIATTAVRYIPTYGAVSTTESTSSKWLISNDAPVVISNVIFGVDTVTTSAGVLNGGAVIFGIKIGSTSYDFDNTIAYNATTLSATSNTTYLIPAGTSFSFYVKHNMTSTLSGTPSYTQPFFTATIK